MTSDISGDCYYGYDPDLIEPGPFETLPPAPPVLPGKFELNHELLPPVGAQGKAGDCFVWASAYGALTYQLAYLTGVSAKESVNQPAVGYTYINYLATNIYPPPPPPPPSPPAVQCPGGQINPFLTFLNGTPSEAVVPTATDTTCGCLWNTYKNSGAPAVDPRFQTSFLQMNFETGSHLPKVECSTILNNIKALLVSKERPLIFGTSLYTDWQIYSATHVPGKPPPVYVGNGTIWIVDGKRVGHVMIIIGYDSTISGDDGAFLIQNSSGSNWGTTWHDQGGYVWMDCHTFLALAQGNLTILTG